eukprot:TRINITY_DN1189_c0_g1_i1.p1 TRINITY_DN1189_c0_g1~~TRINITY_DN1189_c0_g1_i1.p1  ORF type:complete len:714 (+),score=296.39 TRINITY_DN1189_c0_g1_i1:72-2213(+)
MDGGNKLWLRVRMALHEDDPAYQAFQNMYDVACDPAKARKWWLEPMVEELLQSMEHIPLVESNPDVSPSAMLEDEDSALQNSPTGPAGGFMTDKVHPTDVEDGGDGAAAPPPLMKCVASRTLRRLAFGIPNQDSYAITTTYPGQFVCKIDPEGEYLVYEVFEATPFLEAHFDWPVPKEDAVETAQNFDTAPGNDPEPMDAATIFFHEETDRLAFFFMGAFGHFRESRVMRTRVDLHGITKLSLLQEKVDYLPGDRVLFLEPPSKVWKRGTVVAVDGVFLSITTEVEQQPQQPAAKPAAKAAATAASDAAQPAPAPEAAAAEPPRAETAAAEPKEAAPAAAPEAAPAAPEGAPAAGYEADDAPERAAAKAPAKEKAEKKKKAKERRQMRTVTTLRQLVKPEADSHMGVLVIEMEEPVESFAARAVWSREKAFNAFHILGDWTPDTAASESLRHYITGGVAELKKLAQELLGRSRTLRDAFFATKSAPPPPPAALMPDASPLVEMRPPGMRRNPMWGPIPGVDDEGLGGAAPKVTAGMATELAELLIMEQNRQQQEALEEEEREMKRLLNIEKDPDFKFPKNFEEKDAVIDRASAWARGEELPPKPAEKPAAAPAHEPEPEPEPERPAVTASRAPPPATLLPPGRNGKSSWHCGKCKKDGLFPWMKRCPSCGVALAPESVQLKGAAAAPAPAAAPTRSPKHTDPGEVPDDWEDEA